MVSNVLSNLLGAFGNQFTVSQLVACFTRIVTSKMLHVGLDLNIHTIKDPQNVGPEQTK